jgi:SAM-dependent methyltransferase
MNTELSPAERYALDVKHYERDDIVDVWESNYEIAKERLFIEYIDRFIPRDQVRLLDIGCGIGLHTLLWHERQKVVTASDLSTRFQEHVRRTYPFPFIRMDVLNCTLTEQYDICFCMGLATLVLDEERRFQTFATLARLVRPGSYLVLITPSHQWPFRALSGPVPLHSISRRDMEKLKEVGFEEARVFCWGSSLRFLWRSAAGRLVGRAIEAVSFRLGIGARKVVICRRRLNDAQPISL